MATTRAKPRRGPTPPRKQDGNSDVNPRLRRAAQLGYVATVSAANDGCNCRAAKALREQNELMLEDYDRVDAGNGAGPDPQP